MEEVGSFADISMPSTVKTSGAASAIERLCLKLKIPEPQHYKEKEENKEEEEEEVLRFACPLCDKSFNSGKALGGHKRIHNQQPTTTTTFTSSIYSSNGSIGNFNNKATKDQTTGSHSGTNICPMCLKIFPSKMSLFGHMRSHPERSWRGIEPPATSSPPLLLLPKPTCTSMSSTDHDHDHVLDHDDHDRIIIDLAAAPPLVNWAVTAKRGRKSLTRSATSTSPAAASAITTASASHDDNDSSAPSALEDRMKKAVLDLMTLAGASPAATNYNNRPAPPKDDHRNIIFKKRKFAEYSDCHSSQNNGIQVSMQKPKPKLVTKASSASGPCKYVCSVCERSFPCYQALGGHMSSHATATAPAPAPAPRLLNIDLNQPPPPDDDDVDDHQWLLLQQFS